MDCRHDVVLRVVKGNVSAVLAGNVQKLGKNTEEVNIEVMKVLDSVASVWFDKEYGLSDSEYVEAHKELQVLMREQMRGGVNE